MKTSKRLSEELLTKICDHLQKSEAEVYWDYRSELSSDQITLILEGKGNDVECDISDSNEQHIYELEKEHIIETLKHFQNEIEAELGSEDEDFEFDADDLHFEYRDELIDYVSVDLNLKQLIKNTGSVPVRIELLSNYDCINSNHFEGGTYEYKESYFGDMVDALNLNPATLKKAMLEYGFKCVGKFPNKKSRDGKECVTYKDFLIELENSCCGANLLTFLAKIDLNDIIDKEEIKSVTIPVGNNCGLFSSFQGGGSSLDMKLEKPLTVKVLGEGEKWDYTPIFRIINDADKDRGYGVYDVYGVSTSFFGSKLKF